MTDDRRAESPAVQGIAVGLDEDRTRTRDYRRESDKIIAKLVQDQEHLHACVEGVKLAVKENTEITKQIADLLASFRVVASVSKWIAAIAGAVAACIAAFKAYR